VTGDWRRLHNEELHSLYFPPIVINAIKSRMRLVRNVARTGEMGNVTKFLLKKPKGRVHLKDLSVNGRTI
jgi:hypothetical protein